MAVIERPLTERPLREIRGALQRAVEAADGTAAKAILEQLGDHADHVIAEGPLRAIARQRDRIGRISRALQQLDAESPVVLYACGYLDDADRRLDRARTRLLGAQSVQRREAGAAGVRERIMRALSEPRRPKDIAHELQCDPSQVSRAMRELLAAGQVVRVDPPAGADDRRAHWYAQRQLQASSAA